MHYCASIQPLAAHRRGCYPIVMFKTVDAVIDALGGTAAAARKLGRTTNAVSNWRGWNRNKIPPEFYLAIDAILEDAGLPEVDPDVYGMIAPVSDA